jgi:hypothetical protein
MSLIILAVLLSPGVSDPDETQASPLAAEFDRIYTLEAQLSKLVDRFQQKAEEYRGTSKEFIPVAEIQRREAELEDLLVQADNIIANLGKDTPSRRDIRTVPVVLVNSTLSGEQVQVSLTKKSSGYVPESRDFDGWIIYEKFPVLTFKPLIKNTPVIGGLAFPKPKNLPCEVDRFDAVFVLKNSTWISNTFVLNATDQFGFWSFPVPADLDRFAISRPQNQGNSPPFCLPKFVLYYEENSK